jgi:hypothetical protein
MRRVPPLILVLVPQHVRIAVLAVSLVLTVVTTLCSAETPQQGRVWRIGLFHVGLDHVPPSLPGLREGLKALGYEEGKNLRGAVTGVLIVSPNLQTKFSALILRLASERGLPIESHRKEWVQQGALFSYATDFATLGRAAAAQYIDKILGGAKPATLPVQQASTFELVINRASRES